MAKKKDKGKAKKKRIVKHKEKSKPRSKKSLKKRFFEVIVPFTSTKIHLYASDPSDLNGKIVKIDMTKSLRGKSLELSYRVNVSEGSIKGVPEKAELVNSYIRRMMRRGIDYVEDSFEAECRDAFVRVKPFLLTRRRVPRGVRRALREQVKKDILSYFKMRSTSDIFEEIITNKIQRQLSLKLKKIYPLALCEIRIFKVERKKE